MTHPRFARIQLTMIVGLIKESLNTVYTIQALKLVQMMATKMIPVFLHLKTNLIMIANERLTVACSL